MNEYVITNCAALSCTDTLSRVNSTIIRHNIIRYFFMIYLKIFAFSMHAELVTRFFLVIFALAMIKHFITVYPDTTID